MKTVEAGNLKIQSNEAIKVEICCWCGVSHVGDTNQVEEECCHLQLNKLKEQKLQKPLAEDGQPLQTDPDVYAWWSNGCRPVCFFNLQQYLLQNHCIWCTRSIFDCSAM